MCNSRGTGPQKVVRGDVKQFYFSRVFFSLNIGTFRGKYARNVCPKKATHTRNVPRQAMARHKKFDYTVSRASDAFFRDKDVLLQYFNALNA